MLERLKIDLIKTIDNKSNILKIISLYMASTYTNRFNEDSKKNSGNKIYINLKWLNEKYFIFVVNKKYIFLNKI